MPYEDGPGPVAFLFQLPAQSWGKKSVFFVKLENKGHCIWVKEASLTAIIFFLPCVLSIFKRRLASVCMNDSVGDSCHGGVDKKTNCSLAHKEYTALNAGPWKERLGQ